MGSSKHIWVLSGTATSSHFFYAFPSAKSFQYINCSELMFYENYSTLDFHTNTVVSRRGFQNHDKVYYIRGTHSLLEVAIHVITCAC